MASVIASEAKIVVKLDTSQAKAAAASLGQNAPSPAPGAPQAEKLPEREKDEGKGAGQAQKPTGIPAIPTTIQGAAQVGTSFLRGALAEKAAAAAPWVAGAAAVAATIAAKAEIGPLVSAALREATKGVPVIGEHFQAGLAVSEFVSEKYRQVTAVPGAISSGFEAAGLFAKTQAALTGRIDPRRASEYGALFGREAYDEAMIDAMKTQRDRELLGAGTARGFIDMATQWASGR